MPGEVGGKRNDVSKQIPAEEGQTAASDQTPKPDDAMTRAESSLSDNEVEAELRRRQVEAERDWKEADGPTRTGFGLEVGQVEHTEWQAEIRRAEVARGRIEGRDFGIEYVLQHPDGGTVRLDYVDFREDRIVDRKAQASTETDAELIRDYQAQRDRHLEAYKARFGRTPTYEYSPYSSTRDLYGDPAEAGSKEAQIAKELRELGPSVLEGDQGPHPDSATLVVYADGSLDAESARHVRAHVLFCDDCRALAADMERLRS